MHQEGTAKNHARNINNRYMMPAVSLARTDLMHYLYSFSYIFIGFVIPAIHVTFK